MIAMYNKWLKEFEQGIFGYATIGILVNSCLGSIVVMMILQNKGNSMLGMFQVFVITVFCMGYNGAVLSQQKPKLVFNALLISIVASIFVLMINIPN